MIGLLRGILVELVGRNALVDVGGVGYEVECSQSCVSAWTEGQNVSVITYTEVREDALRLHGFADRLERQVFLLLLKVKGVGVRSAVELVSQVDKSDILRMISEGDTRGLASVKGIGKKTAERIVLELKDKVGTFVVQESVPAQSPHASMKSEAMAALQALGFSSEQSRKALKQVDESQSVPVGDVGALVGAALQQL